MVSGAFYIPKEVEGKPEGEEAHFICEEKQTIGVADGVVGWIKHGVDAGKYTRNLMSNFVAALSMKDNQNIDLINTSTIAYSKTACLLTLKDNILHSANVGDSGFSVIRDETEFYKSPVQTRSFNYPCQLGQTVDHPTVTQDRIGKPEGEDAHFICEEKQTIGVADGVGSWSKKGVDAGKYARNLMSNFVAALNMENNQNIDLKNILTTAYDKTLVGGSSTACLLTLENNILHAANVGDSGFLLIRDGAEFYKSSVQTRSFNHPYQLGISADKPSVTQVSMKEVRAGDVVILGTDGLFDNLFTKNIEEIVQFETKDGVKPEQVARAIAEYAYYNSIDKSAPSPFSEACLSNGRARKFYGGKEDDITVVVSFIVNP